MPISMSLFSPPPLQNFSSKTHFVHKPSFLLRPATSSSSLLKPSTDTGAEIALSVASIEEPKTEKEPPIHVADDTTKLLDAANGAIAAAEVLDLPKFVNSSCTGGRWDLSQFLKDGTTDWDAVTYAGKLASARYRVENVGLFVKDASSKPSSEGMPGTLCGSLNSEGSWIMNHIPVCDVFSKWLSDDEAKIQPNFKMMGVVVVSALTMATPFKAMAETCETDNSLLNMPLLMFVAIVGAIVGGLVARQRKGELARLNEQLRQINASLRRQAKIESYAPTLSYAPVGARIQENEVIIEPQKEELISRLKTGKNLLRNQEYDKAFAEFKQALELAQTLKDPIKEKKAARGLGASMQRQGKYREAIKYHSMVLGVSEREGENSGNTEACGAIADCYTELGDLERAGAFYDKYIAMLETE